MQKTPQVQDLLENFEPATDPLIGSGFEEEPVEPEFSGDDNEEAEK